MGKRLIITEEEKKHIIRLYEQPAVEPTDKPKYIDVKQCLLDNGYTGVTGTKHYWRVEKPGGNGNMISVYKPKPSDLNIYVQEFVADNYNGKYLDKGKIEIKGMECSNIIFKIDELYNKKKELNCRRVIEQLLNSKGFQYSSGSGTYFLQRTGINKKEAGTEIHIEFDKHNKGELEFKFYDDGGILDKANKIMNSLDIKNKVNNGRYKKNLVYSHDSVCSKSDAYIFLSKLPENL